MMGKLIAVTTYSNDVFCGAAQLCKKWAKKIPRLARDVGMVIMALLLP